MRRKRDIGFGGLLLGVVALFIACPQSAEKDAIPAAEYEVYTALFGVKAPDGLDSPQFFSAVLDGRLVVGSTLAIEKPLQADWPGKDFGPLEPRLVEDYKAKNRKAWLLADRITVPTMKVISPEELAARLKALAERPADDSQTLFGLDSDYVSLSRVGFNAAGDQALLTAAFTTPRAMGARYLVLMKRAEAAWRLERVVMENLWYH